MAIDERLGLCWLTIRDRQCENNIKQPMLRSQCCSSIGKAWGSPCEPCQRSGNIPQNIITVAFSLTLSEILF